MDSAWTLQADLCCCLHACMHACAVRACVQSNRQNTAVCTTHTLLIFAGYWLACLTCSLRKEKKKTTHLVRSRTTNQCGSVLYTFSSCCILPYALNLSPKFCAVPCRAVLRCAHLYAPICCAAPSASCSVLCLFAAA